MIKKSIFMFLFLTLFIIFIAPFTFAEEQVIINSKDWIDVYSGMLYASLSQKPSKYFVEESQSPLLLKLIHKKKPVFLIESSKNSFTKDFKSVLESNGFKTELYISTDPLETNFELAQRLQEVNRINNFIILSDKNSYDAISVSPYAVLTNSTVLFANKNNINKITPFVKANAKNLLIYGSVDREVKTAFKDLNPEIIDKGNKFDDNIEIAKKFLKINPHSGQVVLSNGEFLETQFFDKSFPLVFIGEKNLPESVINFFEDTGISWGVLVGNDYFDNARELRNKLNVRVFVKFAQGIEGEMYALDQLAIKQKKPLLELKEVFYNIATQKLELVYKNSGEANSYFKALNVEALLSDNTSLFKKIDDTAFFVGEKNDKTIQYDANLVKYQKENIKVKVDVVYGTNENALENVLTSEKDLKIVSADDDSKIDFKDFYYEKKKKRFVLKVENIGSVKAYARPEIFDILINDKKTILSGNIKSLDVGGATYLIIPAELDDIDLQDNKLINVLIYYGQREVALIKTLKDSRELKIKSDNTLIILSSLAVLVIIVIVYLVVRRRKNY